MITEGENKEIRAVLDFRYTLDVQKKLIEKGKFNKNGKPYSRVQIRNTMSGIPHAIIEDAIWELYAEKKQL
ncbi:hypothetical protein [Polaribacter ponticola]|uniref:Uncharacterized protein n=1 Tax=Polaribacter ponticola TaxID=2978475 RepID=A0ABT5S4D2_9FLAO|nr:hypothetical protein [Polaribacter sp. MSW5]MDD7912963.1 hypothetical protein [Polaribacter sp. MSW5]MDD7913739.1 hypothetical protein [Polaribacter sp. MSW5]